jgi:uncharacterized metal-binding protein
MMIPRYKRLEIEWKHFAVGDATCERCGKTGDALLEAVGELRREFSPAGVKINLTETILDKTRIAESNEIRMNGALIEDLLTASVASTDCPSCGTLAGEGTCCRAIGIGDNLYEDMPAWAIKKAAYRVLGVDIPWKSEPNGEWVANANKTKNTGTPMTEESNPAPQRLIFCCSGASNVGVLSFQAAIRLTQEGFGAFSCIAGIGSNNPPMIRAAKLAGERVVIDGCPIGCARKIMDLNLIPIDRYVIVTELGIGKTHGFEVEDSDLETVAEEVKRPEEGTLPVNKLLGRRVVGGDDGS